MIINASRSLSDADVFSSTRPPSLAEVRGRADEGLSGNTRRDTLSAFRVLERKGAVDLAATPATGAEVRSMLAGISHTTLGMTQKRFANIRSLVVAAVERFGPKRCWITCEITPDETWRALLTLVPKREYGWSLSRLACYCTVKRIAPEEVGPETLLGLHEALEAECLVQSPRGLLKQTIAVWNICRRNVPAWPQITLSSPFKTEPYMMPISAFPNSFEQDIASWEQRMLNPDPLDFDAPLKALRAPTLESYRLAFRRIASALVRSGRLAADQVTDLAVLCEPDNLKEGLRPYLPKASDGDSGYAHKMAVQMRNVAIHYLKFDAIRIDAITRLAGRLAPKNGRQMSQGNRSRLAQFDDEAVVQRLLAFPEEEFRRAKSIRNPFRRAKGVERALAIALSICAGLRLSNLRSIRLDGNLMRRGDRVFVGFTAAEMKNDNALELELPVATIRLLDSFLDHHRAILPGADGPYLFPGPDGHRPRSASAMRDAVSKPLRAHADIRINPHLYRHTVSKIVMERAPEMLADLSRRLGHKSVNTTYGSYLGTETPAASRRINALLEDLRTKPKPGGRR